MLTFRLYTFSRQDGERFRERKEGLQFTSPRWNKTKMSSPKAESNELEPRNDSSSWCGPPAPGHTWAEWGFHRCVCQVHRAGWGLPSNRNRGFICNTRSPTRVFLKNEQIVHWTEEKNGFQVREFFHPVSLKAKSWYCIYWNQNKEDFFLHGHPTCDGDVEEAHLWFLRQSCLTLSWARFPLGTWCPSNGRGKTAIFPRNYFLVLQLFVQFNSIF